MSAPCRNPAATTNEAGDHQHPEQRRGQVGVTGLLRPLGRVHQVGVRARRVRLGQRLAGHRVEALVLGRVPASARLSVGPPVRARSAPIGRRRLRDLVGVLGRTGGHCRCVPRGVGGRSGPDQCRSQSVRLVRPRRPPAVAQALGTLARPGQTPTQRALDRAGDARSADQEHHSVADRGRPWRTRHRCQGAARRAIACHRRRPGEESVPRTRTCIRARRDLGPAPLVDQHPGRRAGRLPGSWSPPRPRRG